MRLLLNSLQPGNKYAVQVRSDVGDAVSAWSPKLEFTANVNTTKPAVPQNVKVETVGGDTFVVTWDAVTQKINGKAFNTLKQYRIRCTTDDPTHSHQMVTHTELDTRLDFTMALNKAVFKPEGCARVAFEVRAEDTSGLVGDYSPIVWSNMNAPTAPILDSVKSITDGVELSWSPTDPATTHYRVYVSPEGNFTPTLAMLAWEGDATSYTYQTSTYHENFFAVTAVNDLDVESAPVYGSGTPISPFVWDDTPPVVPTGLSITSDTGDTVVLEWSAPATADETITGYDVEYIKSSLIGTVPGADSWLFADMKPVRFPAGEPVTTISISDIDPFEDYDFRVHAMDRTANMSDWSATVHRTGQVNEPPAAPTGLSVNVSSANATASWQANTEPDLKSYMLQVDKVSTFDGPYLRNYYPLTNQQPDMNLDANTKYFFRVAAVDNHNLQSEWSATVTATTGGQTDGSPPSASPTILADAGLGYIWVHWTAITNHDPVTYEVHVSKTTGFTPTSTTKVGETDSTGVVVTTDASKALVSYGTTYYIRVVAKDADGAAAPSNEVAQSPRQATKDDIVTVNAGSIRTGTLDSAIITLAPGGAIRSTNYDATAGTGYQLNETGLIMYSGTISASTFKGGTISGTTVTIGSGGALVVDSTAVVKSSNYATGSAGWKLSSTGLEVNGITGKISASNISGGTFNAGLMYIASGGGIYDVNGYWSITPSAINIQSGSINAATITSGSMHSSAYAVNASGNYDYGAYAWQLDMNGNMAVGNAIIRGRLTVGTSNTTDNAVIQSSYYYPGSSGFQINSNGYVEFNNADIFAGTFRTRNYNGYLELGDTGPNDLADELRFFNNGSVSSIRNKSGEGIPNLYFSLPGGAFSFWMSDYPVISPVAPSFSSSRPALKFASAGVQVRNSRDNAYQDFAAQDIIATNSLKTNNGLYAYGPSYIYGNLTASGQSTFSSAVTINALTTMTGSVCTPSLGTAGDTNPHIVIGASGYLRQSTSSARFKENISDADIDIDKILKLQPRKYQRNDDEDKDGNLLAVTEETPWSIGFIAEEAKELGLDQWVTLDSEGKPFSFSYTGYVVAHQAVLQRHRDEIGELKTRIDKLEKMLSQQA